MNNMRDIWGKRFVHYVTELQKYLRFIFTGHTVLVIVFTIGASGYAYSEWLKEVPTSFPAALLTAVILGGVIAYSPPITLLRPADSIFFLPMEMKLNTYLTRALSWTFFSQLIIPCALFIVSLPLLKATETASNFTYIVMLLVILLSKWLDVETEFNVRHAREGEGIWIDRGIRFLLVASIVFFTLQEQFVWMLVIGLVMALYSVYWRKQKNLRPLPYEHFIALEQNRMMRFYRFANYFTDVPHLRGSVSRRAWLGFLLNQPNFTNGSSQAYLIRRTFLRTDDYFWLWTRLTVLSLGGIILIPFPILVVLFVSALAFASAIQLIHGLQGSDEFRMDMLFPKGEEYRPLAIRQFVRRLQWLQCGLVAIVAIIFLGMTLTTVAVIGGVLIVSELTIRFVHNSQHDE